MEELDNVMNDVELGTWQKRAIVVAAGGLSLLAAAIVRKQVTSDMKEVFMKWNNRKSA